MKSKTALAQLIALSAFLSGCVMEPFDNMAWDSVYELPDSMMFRGFSRAAPGMAMRVQTKDSTTGGWDTIGTGTTASTLLPAGTWIGSPALTSWSISIDTNDFNWGHTGTNSLVELRVQEWYNGHYVSVLTFDDVEELSCMIDSAGQDVYTSLANCTDGADQTINFFVPI